MTHSARERRDAFARAASRDPTGLAPLIQRIDEWVRESCLVLDAVYRPINTALLRACKRKGGTPVPGGEWFVRQAAAQFQLFTHQEADDSLMRAAFEHGLIDSGSPPSSTGGR